MDTATFIQNEFASLAGKRILDIGCGTGALLRMLQKNGAEAVGVDPAAPGNAFETDGLEAPTAGTNPVVVRAGAESLPFGDGTFDGASILNALHHVPMASMDAALREAARILKPEGKLLIIEPLAEGSFFAALRRIEDETEARAAAQAAIARALDAGVFGLRAQHDYIRQDAFESIAPFLQRVIDADDSRRLVISESRDEIERAFEEAAGRDVDGKYTLQQPIRMHVLIVG